MIDLWTGIFLLLAFVIWIVATLYTVKTTSYNQGWWDCYIKITDIRNGKDD